MRKSFCFKHRACRAETSLFFPYAGAFTGRHKTKGDLLFTVHKTRAYTTHAEPDSFFPVHGHRFSPLVSIYLKVFKRRS